MGVPRDRAVAAREAFNQRFDNADDPAAARSAYYRELNERSRVARRGRAATPVVVLVLGRDVPADLRVRDVLKAAQL